MSGSILCVLVLAHPQFLHSYRVLFIEVYNILAVGFHPFQCTRQWIHPFQWMSQYPKLQDRTIVLTNSMNQWSDFCWTSQDQSSSPSSWTMWHLLLNSSWYSTSLNVSFTAYALSPTFPNCLSSLPQMEPTPIQVRNHYSQSNQEAHLEGPLVVKNAANLYCPSNVCQPIISLYASCCRWLITPMSLKEAAWWYWLRDR